VRRDLTGMIVDKEGKGKERRGVKERRRKKKKKKKGKALPTT